MARLALLDHVPIPAGNIHPVECPGPQGGSDPALREAAAWQAAAEYEKRLREFFGAGAAGFDLVLLGLGNDGHTASLLPRSDVLEEREGWVAATPETIGAGAVAEGAIRDTSERPWRVTLTAPLINRAGLVLFLVSGASKAGAVKAALDGDPDFRELPAILIRPASGRVQWLLDEDAASALEGKPADESAGARSPGTGDSCRSCGGGGAYRGV